MEGTWVAVEFEAEFVTFMTGEARQGTVMMRLVLSKKGFLEIEK
jgi:hypothetical protein